MSRIRLISLAALAGYVMLPGALLAADPASTATTDTASTAAAPAKPAASQKKKGLDPNEVVCRKEDVLGSRLQTRKVCMTRSEWAEARRETRGVVERAQTQRPISTQ